MSEIDQALAAALEGVNSASPFNRMAGFRVIEASAGAVTLAGDAAAELTNHAGALHAGVAAALIDTACGFAAGSVAGNVVTLQMNLNFLASAKGERFEARARVTKAGQSLIFAEALLYAIRGDEEVLVASGTTVLAKTN